MPDFTAEELWEQEMIDSGVLRYYQSIERTKTNRAGANIYTESNTSYGISMLRTFVKRGAKQLTHEHNLKKGKPGRLPEAWYYLTELEHEAVAYITCKSIMDSISRTVTLTI